MTWELKQKYSFLVATKPLSNNWGSQQVFVEWRQRQTYLQTTTKPLVKSLTYKQLLESSNDWIVYFIFCKSKG